MERGASLLGGLGALFIVLGFLPYVGPLLTLAGVVLLLLALRKLSDSYPEKRILKDFLLGLVTTLVGGLVMIVGGISTLFGAVKGVEELTLSVGLLVTMLLFYILLVAASYFYKRSFTSVAEVTGNNLFAWAGRLLFWGSIATVIVVGVSVIWVGWILLTVAFFTAPAEA